MTIIQYNIPDNISFEQSKVFRLTPTLFDKKRTGKQNTFKTNSKLNTKPTVISKLKTNLFQKKGKCSFYIIHYAIIPIMQSFFKTHLWHIDIDFL